MGIRVSDLFDIEYGHSLALNKLSRTGSGKGVAFVSRTAKNNGVSAWVVPVRGLAPLPAGLLTVCLRSRNYTLSTFVQPRAFYCGYHIYVLRPKEHMDLREKLWWAECIKANRYRYNFGRQANRSLAALELPEDIPDWVRDVRIPQFSSVSFAPARILDPSNWKPFRLDQLFDLARGRNVLKRDLRPGSTAYVSASAINNGISAMIDLPPDYPGGIITVSSNGSVGETFYQPDAFIASGDVTVLRPKSPMSEAVALFVSTLLFAEKYRWNYGRKWSIGRLKESIIRLPVTSIGDPDWEEAARFMHSLALAPLVLGPDELAP